MKKSFFSIAMMAFIGFAMLISCSKIEEEVIVGEPRLKVAPLETVLATPVVTVIVTEAEVTVSWTAIQNAIGYEVIFGGDYLVNGEANTTSLSITRPGLQNGNYTVKVRALANPEYWYFVSSPYCADLLFTINVIVPPTDPPVQEVLCSYSQGFYFGNKKAWPAPTVEVAGYTYTESEARAIWGAKNGKGGITDSKKAFCQIVAIKLSGTTVPEVLGYVAIAEAWLATVGKLSPSNLPSGNKDVSNAAGAISEFINGNHCD